MFTATSVMRLRQPSFVKAFWTNAEPGLSVSLATALAFHHKLLLGYLLMASRALRARRLSQRRRVLPSPDFSFCFCQCCNFSAACLVSSNRPGGDDPGWIF